MLCGLDSLTLKMLCGLYSYVQRYSLHWRIYGMEVNEPDSLKQSKAQNVCAELTNMGVN